MPIPIAEAAVRLRGVVQWRFNPLAISPFSQLDCHRAFRDKTLITLEPTSEEAASQPITIDSYDPLSPRVGQMSENAYGKCAKEPEGMLMAKKLAIALALLMVAIVAWGLFLESGGVTIVINGREVTGPFQGAIGAGGLVVVLIALFCTAILLLFVFAGIGLMVLGLFVFLGTVLAVLAFPFLLPLLIPLAILWGFVAMTRRTNAS